MTSAYKKYNREHWLHHFFFTIYFKHTEFNHLHETTSQLLARIFASYSHQLVLTNRIIPDPAVAELSLQRRLTRLIGAARAGDLPDLALLKDIENALRFVEAPALKKIPWYLQ